LTGFSSFFLLFGGVFCQLFLDCKGISVYHMRVSKHGKGGICEVKIGAMELIVIFIVALLIIGPDKLPMYAKKFGNALREFRKASAGMTQDIRESVVEPLEEAQRPLREAMEPLEDLKSEVETSIKGVEKDLKGVGKSKSKDKAKAKDEPAGEVRDKPAEEPKDKPAEEVKKAPEAPKAEEPAPEKVEAAQAPAKPQPDGQPAEEVSEEAGGTT
jgi:sec-independent protein translocase protein TatB